MQVTSVVGKGTTIAIAIPKTEVNMQIEVEEEGEENAEENTETEKSR